MSGVTLAFDVYGTLIDTHGIVELLKTMVGGKADAFSREWRRTQLEYSFRRGLMRRYETFAVCTAQALDRTCAVYGTSLGGEQKRSLLSAYRTLPAFGDVEGALRDLKASGFRIFAFSNGTADAVEELLSSAGIGDCFLGVVSVDELRSFKPDPAVYRHFLRQTGAEPRACWLVSGNPFDVIGAVSSGMRAAWLDRSGEAPFDSWGVEPDVVVRDLAGLGGRISARACDS